MKQLTIHTKLSQVIIGVNLNLLTNRPVKMPNIERRKRLSVQTSFAVMHPTVMVKILVDIMLKLVNFPKCQKFYNTQCSTIC